MKIIAYVLGVLCIALAIVYFVVPADQLPSFLPGHLAASTHLHHMKHGIAAAVVGVILLAIGWFAGGRASAAA